MSTHFRMWFFQQVYKVDRTKICVTSTFCPVSESACYSHWFSPSSWKCPRRLIRHSVSPRMPQISLHSSSWTTLLSCSHIVLHTSPSPLSSLLLGQWHSRFLSTLSPGTLFSSTSHTTVPRRCTRTKQKIRMRDWVLSISVRSFFCYSFPWSPSHANVRYCSAIQIIAVSLLT